MSSSQPPSPPPPLRVGMLGAGTVGGGVYEILMGTSTRERVATASTPHHHHAAAAHPTPFHHRSIVVTKLCVQSLTKPRDFTIFERETTLTTNWRDLVADDIDCVVEVAGGCGVAKDLILTALAQNKAVVTANKAVLFEYMKEIQNATQASNATAVTTSTTTTTGTTAARIGYEAAVCGGIPILNTLITAYAGDTIHSVQGICNGTTNFMLSHMQSDATVSYDTVLRQAQALGYAEADPTADVDGHDVRAKIAIVAQLAFGTSPTLPQILCTGIRSVTAMDFAVCRDSLQSTIKLIGTAKAMTADDDDDDDDDTNNTAPRSLCVTVHPTVVPLSHAFAAVGGCGNAVSIRSRHIDTLTLTGPGAGRYPTAQSICADVYRAAAGTLATVAFPKPTTRANDTANNEECITIVTDYSSCFYVRVTVTEETTALALAASLSQALPVDKLLRDGHDGTVALVTTACLFSTVQTAVDGQALNLDGETLIMPLLPV